MVLYKEKNVGGDIMEKEHALELLTRIAEGLAHTFGSSCETVIHDLQDKDHSIVAIANGQVTGRKVGDSLMVLGTKTVDDLMLGRDLVNCDGRNRNGRLIKSSTFHARGEDYHYALGVNFDYTHLALARAALDNLTRTGETIDEAIDKSASNLLDEIFDECLQNIGKPVALLTREDRRKMISQLNDRGAFAIQKGIPTISARLNISRYTIYNYLKKQP